MYRPNRRWLGARKPSSVTGRSRACSIEVGLLEGRFMLSGVMNPPCASPEVVRFTLNRMAHETRAVLDDSTTPIVTASAHPSSLWPPNHKFDPVTVNGHVADDSSNVRRVVRYQVFDEYGQVQPSGAATVHANGNYSFVVRLQSSRLGQDKDGRQYTIVVWATDPAGHTGSATALVVVPHDRGHGEGSGHGGGNGNHGNGHG
jgi:hypothetical protein